MQSGLGLYVLDDDGRPLPVDDFLVWGQWCANTDRTVAQDEVGTLEVSTVFLGIGYSYNEQPPLLWETMVFSRTGQVVTACRWPSREAAVAGHAAIVARVQHRRHWPLPGDDDA